MSNLKPTASRSSTETVTGIKKPNSSSSSNSLYPNLKPPRHPMQTTSTPFNQTNLPPISANPIQINSYIGNNQSQIISPPQFNDISDLSKVNNNKSQQNYPPPPLINIINNSSLMSEERVISYRRIKKTVTESEELKEIELREKEQYLQQLKSIDLNKFSFPNENKPKTDYTYAKTSSYRSECTDRIEDNVDMPNLCRRGRKSPQNSFLSNMSTVLFTKTTSPSKSIRESSINLLDESINIPKKTGQGQGGVYNNIKNWLFKDVTTKTTTKNTNQAVASTSSSQNVNIRPPGWTSQNSFSTSSSSDRLERNLNRDFEEENAQCRSGAAYKRKALSGALLESADGRVTRSKSKTLANGQNGSGISTQFTATSTYMHLDANGTRTKDEDGKNVYINIVNENRRRSICCGLPFILIFLFLLPFIAYGLNYLDSQHQIYSRANNYLDQYHVDKFFAFSLGPVTVYTLNEYAQKTREYAHACKDTLVYFFTIYLPERASTLLDKLLNETYHVTKKATDYLYDFKPSTNGGYDITSNVLKLDRDELLKNLNAVKENLLAETLNKMNDAKQADIELIRREFDQKFNYTLAQISNKMADQLIQIEKHTKSTYESEVSQLKGAFAELEARYKMVLGQMQEEITKVRSEVVNVAKAATTIAPPPNSVEENTQSLKNTFSDEHVSFKQIEEYINRTLHRFAADKTGMTDFASEAIGGTILFTRCTEEYSENSRWFTVFDVPISRIRVSPRVVIQGSILPGNCWSFKGAKADLFIKLAAKIVPKSFSLEHIPKELSLTGLIDSAPQNFTVYGYVNKDEINDENRLLLGNFHYDNESVNTLQFFGVQHEYSNKPISVVELKIESNWGHVDYTCLYKFRVHGQLYKENQANKPQQQQQDTEVPVLNTVVNKIKSSIGKNSNEKK